MLTHCVTMRQKKNMCPKYGISSIEELKEKKLLGLLDKQIAEEHGRQNVRAKQLFADALPVMQSGEDDENDVEMRDT